jgi:hypothetical protein
MFTLIFEHFSGSFGAFSYGFLKFIAENEREFLNLSRLRLNCSFLRRVSHQIRLHFSVRVAVVCACMAALIARQISISLLRFLARCSTWRSASHFVVKAACLRQNAAPSSPNCPPNSAPGLNFQAPTDFA